MVCAKRRRKDGARANDDTETETGDAQAYCAGERTQVAGVEAESWQSGMKYIVRALMFKDGKSQNDFWEFFTKEEAEDFAEWKANQLRKYGYEFCVNVYELIN